MLGVAGLAAGSAAMLGVAVWLRAASRAASRGRMNSWEPVAPMPLAVSFDQPTGLPLRVDQSPEPWEPSRVTRANADGFCPGAVAVAGR
jgi:hypothetical protein